MGLLKSSSELAAAVIFTFALLSTTNCFDGRSKPFSIPLHKIDRGVYNRTRSTTETDFYVEIRVGTPPQTLHVVFDTGYADMWVASSFDVKCTGDRCYDHHKSRSYVENGTKVVTNESGTKLGFLSQDIIQVGYDCEIKNLTFAEVTRPVTSLLDGVVGLGFRNLSRFMNPVFITAHEKGLIERNIFAFYYNKSNPNASEITLGGWNKNVIKSGESIRWVPLIERRSWKFEMEGLVIGDLKIKARAAIADTGSAMILGPRNDILKIAEYFKGILWGEQNIIRVTKDDFKNIPSITFNINGNDYRIARKEIIIKETKDGGYLLAFGAKDNISHWVLGDHFLSNYYTIFDMGAAAVGFAPLTGGASPSPEGPSSLLIAAACSFSVTIGIVFACCSLQIKYSRGLRNREQEP